MHCDSIPAPAFALAPAPGNKSRHFMTVLGCSLALHAFVFWGLQGDGQIAAPPAQLARMTMRALPPPAPVAAPEPVVATAAVEPPPAAQVRAKQSKAATRVERPAPPVVSRPLEPQKAAAPEPVDFTGVTLTSAGAGGWASVTGNGLASGGPLGAPPRGEHAGSARGVLGTGQAKVATGPVVASLASLSRPPRAPSLDGALLDNYPRHARDQGQTGHAVVRARILPDGRVDATRVLIASAPEFGRACQRTLSGSRWSPPLDAHGQPVATDISYTCQFEVSR